MRKIGLIFCLCFISTRIFAVSDGQGTDVVKNLQVTGTTVSGTNAVATFKQVTSPSINLGGETRTTWPVGTDTNTEHIWAAKQTFNGGAVLGGDFRTNWPTSGVATSGVVSISATGAVSGVITFSGSGVTQTNNNFNFSGGEGLWEIDIFGRLVPTIDGVTDSAWELVENRIVPK